MHICKIIFSAGIVLSIVGCSSAKNLIQEAKPQEAMKAQRMVEKELLKEGKNILIVPFTAGEDVRATDELDKISLMLVRGVYDEFVDNKARFEIITAEALLRSEFLIEGHVTKMYSPSWFSRVIFRKKEKGLTITGKMTDLNTGRVILSFDDEVLLKGKSVTYKDAAHKIGKRLGRFILSADQ